ncbi:MAG: NapC/NirT family cytochrome c [Marinobacterium sp.]|nr:NapC/NirT family cytochrome c [Marinobacterium sp.]
MGKVFWSGLVLSIIGLLVSASWMGVDKALHITSDAAFCGSCHSMKPMQQTFLHSTHGGRSVLGIQALCTDCHLPQDSQVSYLYHKARNGAWDVWKEYVLGAEDVDWVARLDEADRYVYDSGCLKCHNNLEKGSQLSNRQFVAHKPYFQSRIEKQCIDCHDVGHPGLRELLTDSAQ